MDTTSDLHGKQYNQNNYQNNNSSKTSNTTINNNIDHNTINVNMNDSSLAGNSGGRGKQAAAMEARAANMDALIKARYFAFDQKRTMPPRLNPVGILVMIMMGGLIFIGLTITIVSNWPGLATIGEDRMKIAGPIILVLGMLGFILAVIAMAWWARKRNRRWEREMTERAHKYISKSQEPIVDRSYQSSHEVPGRQRKGQGATDGRLKFGRGVGEGRMVVGGLPISADNNKGTISKPGDEPEEGSIPDPHRKQKQHRMLRLDSDWSAGSTNQSFSAGEADMNIPGISFTQLPDQSGVRVVTKTTKTTTTKVKRIAKEGSGSSYGDAKVDPIRDVLSGNGKKLRVLIKAQQGTAVKISPSPTPPTGGHPTRLSMDTEI